MKIKNIIFDWSGTLCDDFKLSLLSTNETLRHFGGQTVTLAQYRKNFELPVERFYSRQGCLAPADEINHFYFERFSPLAGKAKLFKGVPHLLQTLGSLGYKIYLCSTVRQNILEEMCRRYKIDVYLDGIYGSVIDKVVELKQVLKKEKIKASQTLFIGDMDHDILAAKKNGLLAGALFTGYHDESRLLELFPDFAWNDHDGLKRSLESLSQSTIIKLPLFKPKPSSALRTSLQKKTAHHRNEFSNLIFRHKIQEATSKHFPVSTVGALIINKGDVFLIQTHKWGHTFGIPGGKIRYKETSIDALRREIKEETGLTIKNIRWAMVHDSVCSDEFHKRESHFLLLNYYAESTSRNFKLNHEAEAGFWIDPRRALSLRLNRPTRLLIEEYLLASQ